jgi:hypothetical protein
MISLCRGFLLAALFWGGVSGLPAGTVITLTNGSEADGKITLTGTAIHVEGDSAPPDISLSDVLEADFGEAPFSLDCLFLNKGNQLLPAWKMQDINTEDGPGSLTVTDGTIKMTGGGTSTKKKLNSKDDNLFFAGQSWTGDGEWSVRVKTIDPDVPFITGGLMLRDSLDPDAVMCGLEPSAKGVIRLPFRLESGRSASGASTPGDVPVWLRLTRYENKIFSSVSSDGANWNIVAESAFKDLAANPWVGLFVTSRKEGVLSNMTFDQVSLTPPPSTAQVLPPGVLLQNGTFLAGTFARLSFDPANADTNGEFTHDGKTMPISRDLIAAVITLPIERSQIAKMGAKTGILMKNGDIIDGGQLSSITSTEVSVSSVLLGMTPYKRLEVRGCFVHAPQLQPGAFEVRLRDGSIINASAIAGDASESLITDVGGLTIQASQDEVAQIRAGTAAVQDLAQLDWKATPPPATSPAPDPAPATNAPPANPTLDANGNPIVEAVPPAPPLVQSWMGRNQEQIMETGLLTAIEFPLSGKFRAMGVQIALSSDSPPNSNATVRILADGREVARTPPFRAGDPPRFMEVTLRDPARVTLVAESVYPGVKVLYIDPLAVRD